MCFLQKPNTGPKLSAKQRRELKKTRKLQQLTADDRDNEDNVSWLADESSGGNKSKKERQLSHPNVEQQPQQQLKRGQKVGQKYAKQF